VSVG
jgi:hypothetical protein